MKKSCSLLLALLMPASVWAQSASSSDDPTTPVNTSHWQLGLGVAASDNAYVGQGSKITPFPLVVYQGDRFFIQGITAGVHLLKSDGVAIDAIVTTGFNNVDANDFSRADLARRGINRNDLDDRDRSIDAGFAASWTGRFGQLRAVAKTDISGNSEGAEYSLEYGYRMHWAGFTITPNVGAVFLSSKVADYYYGIHSDERRRGVPGYVPGGSLIPQAGIGVVRPIGDKWTLLINAKYTELPDKISHSPLVDGSHGTTVLIGFSRAL
ncbi:MipA/OmpV family protein [Dyella sp.]|uniref:MipA/OmpV family protein n=1 Tax=Dyella sp. TaxID=1869338 RepID=UPI002ED44F8D